MALKKLNLAEGRERAKTRPAGYFEEVISRGQIDGDFLWIKEGDLEELRAKYRTEKRKLPEPTLADLASNFGSATAKWAESGFKIASKTLYKRRSEVCEGDQTNPKCEFWDGSARFGLGKCAAPGCGCTSLKRWLVTEKCPLRRWPE